MATENMEIPEPPKPRKRRNVAVIGFPDVKDENRAKAEWPFEIALIYLDACLVDDTFQRPPQRVFINFLIEEFDETLVGCIAVNERKNGFLSILDGQQRFLAMQVKGKTACYAAVYRGMTIADEAGFFYRMNRDRKSMPAYYGFRARRVAGDPEAEEIAQIVEAQGFVIGPTSNENEIIGAIRSLEIAHAIPSEIRDDSLTPALLTIRESIYGRKGSLDAWMIQGLARFWSLVADEEVERKVILDILSEYGPSGVLAIVRDRQAAQVRRSQPWLMAAFLAQRYNTAIRGSGKPRLPMTRFQ